MWEQKNEWPAKNADLIFNTISDRFLSGKLRQPTLAYFIQIINSTKIKNIETDRN